MMRFHLVAIAVTLLLVFHSVSSQPGRLTLPDGIRLPKVTSSCNCSRTPTTNAPVCGGDLATYGNECVAYCANVLISSEGACPVCKIDVGDCQCGDQPFSPVCAFGLTWSSKCDADCGGYSCPQTPGVCFYNANGTFESTPGGMSPVKDVATAAANTALPAITSATYDYSEALHKTLIFSESMRSGVLDRQRLAWRGDSCSDCIGPKGEDMSGGYYEAGGSFLKLGLVEAFLVTMQAWSVDQFSTGFYKADNMENALDAIKWGADYLVNAHSAPNQFVAVVGNSTLDFNYYGPVEEYADYVKQRPSCYINATNPGSEIAGEAAAALAAASIVLKAESNSSTDASTYLKHAKELYAFATTFPGSYQNLTDPCLEQHGMLYKSSGYEDELAWAAAWLYKATSNASYLADAKKYYSKLAQPGYSFETGEKLPALQVLMAEVDPTNAAKYQANSKVFLNLYLQQTIPHTPLGLAYPYHWGALRPVTQAAMLALLESKQLRRTGGNVEYAAQLFNYAKYQIDYVLGDSGRSWLVGFGDTYPDRLWHKPSYVSYIDWPLRGVEVYANWSAQQTSGKFKQFEYVQASKLDMEGSRTPQKFIAYGALYGAPLQNDGIPSFTRKDYTYAETTTDGITGVTGALAALTEFFTTKQGKQTDCGLDLGWTHPNATLLAKSINNTAICLGVKPPVAGKIPAVAQDAVPPSSAASGVKSPVTGNESPVMGKDSAAAEGAVPPSAASGGLGRDEVGPLVGAIPVAEASSSQAAASTSGTPAEPPASGQAAVSHRSSIAAAAVAFAAGCALLSVFTV